MDVTRSVVLPSPGHSLRGGAPTNVGYRIPHGGGELWLAAASFIVSFLIMFFKGASNGYYTLSAVLSAVIIIIPIALHIIEGSKEEGWIIRKPLTLFLLCTLVYNVSLFRFEFPFVDTSSTSFTLPWTRLVPGEWWAASSRTAAVIFLTHGIVILYQRARRQGEALRDLQDIAAFGGAPEVFSPFVAERRRQELQGLMLRREEAQPRRFTQASTPRREAQRARRVVVFPPETWWWNKSIENT